MANTVYRRGSEEGKGGTTLTARITRGIKLAAERPDEFERVSAWTWIVPGHDRETYTVDLRHSYCTCEDFQIRRSRENKKPEPCKHCYACEIVSAKRKMTRARAVV